MTRGQVKEAIRANLFDEGVTFYSDSDLNESIQDAYDDIAFIAQNITKRVTVNYRSHLVYYNFVRLGIDDFLGALAIFDNQRNDWLNDSISLKDLDRINTDWELWSGTPEYWISSSFGAIAIVPHKIGTVTAGAFEPTAFDGGAFYTQDEAITGTFDLMYYAQAPVLTSDSDSFLIAVDKQRLIEQYATGDLLEQATEFVKAGDWLTQYFISVNEYKERIHNLAKIDRLLMV